MDFFARLKRTSSIWHDWNGGHRLGGLIAGVPFRLTRNREYMSDVLTPVGLTALKDHTSVILEVITNIDVPSVPVENMDQAELDRIFEESLRSPSTVEAEPVEAAREPPPRPVPDPPKPPPRMDEQRSARYAGQQNPRLNNRGRR